MGIFDIFKKRKSDLIEILDLLAKNKITIPKVKLNTLKITQEEFYEYSEVRHKNFKATRLLDEKNHPSLIGVIVGYHPYPKNITTRLTAVVEWPAYEKSERTFVVDCTSLGKSPTTRSLTYPIDGTWIYFRETGEAEDTDGKTRTYGIAETIFDPELVKAALKSKLNNPNKLTKN